MRPIASPEVPPSPSPSSPAPVPAGNTDEARGAGRGGLAVAGAKVWFILVGLVQQTLLPRFIGMDGYGAFSIVLAVANIPNNVITSSSIQGVSRAVAGAGPAHEEEAQRRALRIHAILAPCLAALFFGFAPLAADFAHAPHVLRPLRIFAVVLLVYGLYTPLVGALNGKRKFVAQAGLDVSFATLRTIGMLGSAYWLGAKLDGPTGAAIGVAVAATAILPFAIGAAGLGRAGSGGVAPKQHLAALGPIALGQLFLNLLMQADIWLLRRFTHEAGEATGITGEALRVGTDTLVGAYRAAQLFAFLPYQLLLSITFILFPMVARAHAQKDEEAVRGYVRTGLRLGLVLAGLMVSCTSGLAPHLLRFAYPQAAADNAGTALRILALGQGAFAIFGIETTVLVSLSRERSSAMVTGAAALLVASFCAVLVPSSSFDSSLLVRTAASTAIALVFAAAAGAVLVHRAAKTFAPAKTLARVGIALAVAIAVGTFMPWWGKIAVPVQAVIVVATYVIVAMATGELTKNDLGMVLAIVGKKRGAKT
ncbi:MAG: lipopolysaccharide biosynthesis protein [Polyangiaceae bacterium]